MFDISLKKLQEKDKLYVISTKIKIPKNKQIKIYIIAINSTYKECVANYNWQLYAILLIIQI